MKGIVFTEYLEYLEKEHSYDLVDQVIVESAIPSEGSYTAIGSYHFNEMELLLTHTSRITGEKIPDLLRGFGRHIFGVFLMEYAGFFTGKISSFDILTHLEDTIHPEVQKLYPDAELPAFEIMESTEDKLTMIYKSERKMSDFALGLIEACMDHFNEKGTVQTQKLDKDGSEVRFDIRKDK